MCPGKREDGTDKLRAVDDMTASSCNICTGPTEKLRCDTLDIFSQLLLQARDSFQVHQVGHHMFLHNCILLYQDELCLWKADVDSAFRRIPIRCDHRQFAYIVFSTVNGTFYSGHKAMPFGSIASVHCWDRVGKPTICVILQILPLHYVSQAVFCVP